MGLYTHYATSFVSKTDHHEMVRAQQVAKVGHKVAFGKVVLPVSDQHLT